VRFTPSVMGACVLLLLLVVLLHIRAGGHAQWIAAGGTEHVDTEQRLWSQAQAIVERWSGVGGDPNPGANCSAGADGSLCELSCFTLPPLLSTTCDNMLCPQVELLRRLELLRRPAGHRLSPALFSWTRTVLWDGCIAVS
jgi:hypothetical protein